MKISITSWRCNAKNNERLYDHWEQNHRITLFGGLYSNVDFTSLYIVS